MNNIVNQSKLVAALAGLTITVLAWAQDSDIDAAKQFFAQYAALENAYDPGLADLYADAALIRQRRKMPMGEPKDVIVPAPKYKTMLRQSIAMARERGDRSNYSDVTYTREGEFVRIDAMRFSEMNKRTNPFRIVVGQSPSGEWLIYEEVSASRM